MLIRLDFVNEEFNTNVLRFSFSSLITPTSTYDYNMKTKERTLLKQDEVVGGYNEHYTSKRMYASARDGNIIPISMVYRKNLKQKNAKSFALGYGAYGSTRDPFFSSSRLSLLDRFIYAMRTFVAVKCAEDNPMTMEKYRTKNTFMISLMQVNT